MKRILSIFTSAVLAATTVLLGYPVTGNAVDSDNVFNNASLTEYHIKTTQDFVDFNQSNLDFQGKTIYLDADIDMEGVNWTPKDFFGCFDGQYHTIKNYVQDVDYSYYSDSYCGLFLHNYGIIRRVNVDSFSLSATSYYYGVVSDGSLPGSGCICESPGSSFEPAVYYYNNPAYVGGICTFNQGKIYGCTADGEIRIEIETQNVPSQCIPPNYSGELAGSICAVNNGKITYCTGEYNISDRGYYNTKYELDDDWTHKEADALILSDDIAAMGLLTVSAESINTYVGISQRLDVEINGSAVDADCSSMDNSIATIDRNKYNTYYVKGVSAGDTSIKFQFGKQVRYVDVHVSEMGELVVSPESVTIYEGESRKLNITMNNEPINAYCDVTDSKIVTVSNNTITGKSFGETQIKVTFGEQVKYIDVHVYGNIKNIPADDFSDMNADEFRITTADGLLAFAEACNESGFYEKTVYLDADIDMTGKGYVPPDYFSGTFDGRNHTIYGIQCNAWTEGDKNEFHRLIDQEYKGDYDYYAGVFVDKNYGTICRLTLKNVSFDAYYGMYETGKVYEWGGMGTAALITINPHLGGVCGKNYGSVSECKASGTIHLEETRTSYNANNAVVYDVFGNPIEDEMLEEFWLIDRYLDNPSYYPLDGDINNDGKFNVADIVLLQKWLLAVPDTHLDTWKAADLCTDNRLDVFDLVLIKRELINSQNK